MDLKGYHKSADQCGGYVNLVKLWRDFEVKDQMSECSNGANGMVRLAMWILSMVPNSAPTERVLSHFGGIHTKSHNRLDSQRVKDMTIVTQNIEQKYGAAPQPLPPRMKRMKSNEHFNNLDGDDQSEPNIDGNQILETVDGPDLTSFEEIAWEIMDEPEDDQDSEEGQEPVVISETSYHLKNLFQYPTSNNPQPASLSFMIEFWAKGEAAMDTDIQLHENLSSVQECNDDL
ncbi:hypothetical protein VKT23_019382 [Stygiomarasmius scandens]|uniref:Uncharacterized protein n=1 Tax=Marasmiellus scandens TaxID=2682957 RepID=A0ABR1IR01_9AGAR